jgi:ComF family protein
MGLTHPGCLRKYGIDGCVFLYKYNNYLKTIIKALKYRLVKDGFEELMTMSYEPLRTKLGGLITSLKLFPTLSPIPLNIYRENQRGFNQSKIISSYIGSYLRLDTKEYLTRVKKTNPQAMLKSKLQRYRNLNGAFIIKEGSIVSEKTIILIDDVVTSGSTVREAVRVLKRNKALKVFVFALAKG